MIDMIVEVKSKEPTEKIEKLPETGNYFMMVDNNGKNETVATIWKRQKNGDLEPYAFVELALAPELNLIKN